MYENEDKLKKDAFNRFVVQFFEDTDDPKELKRRETRLGDLRNAFEAGYRAAGTVEHKKRMAAIEEASAVAQKLGAATRVAKAEVSE